MQYIIEELVKNKAVFIDLMKDCDKELQLWRPQPEKWCLLEIICHLYDEERLDFRLRTKWVLEKLNQHPPPFNPLNWLEEHQYLQQDFNEMIIKFSMERDASIDWLNSLKDPKWSNSFEHSKFGTMRADYFLRNWLAHDYLHIRQITRLKYNYLKQRAGNDLDYAGTW